MSSVRPAPLEHAGLGTWGVHRRAGTELCLRSLQKSWLEVPDTDTPSPSGETSEPDTHPKKPFARFAVNHQPE